MVSTARASVFVGELTLYSDGSGAPTTVSCGGYVYACDYLGGARVTLVKPVSGSRLQSEVAYRRVTQVYTAAVLAQASEAWLQLNSEMYKD